MEESRTVKWEHSRLDGTGPKSMRRKPLLMITNNNLPCGLGGVGVNRVSPTRLLREFRVLVSVKRGVVIGSVRI